MNIVCVYSFKESSWISCQKIVLNLRKSYEALPDVSIINFNYDQETEAHHILELAKTINNKKITKLVIMDHKPHPFHLLQHLVKLVQVPFPEIIFHLFGDFTIYYPHWRKTEALIKELKVKFIVASERQKKLIDNFLCDPQCFVCPFPFDKAEFNYDDQLRKKQRSEWEVEDKTKIFIYTGRLSRQKRIHTLITSFAAAAANNPEDKSRLYFYGQFDHIADQFLNIWENEGEYYRRIVKLHDSLSESISSRIHFMGNVDSKKLNSIYNGADYFISLSVHNDEDYGMSVAEAQACGLPCILSDWAGFSSFEFQTYKTATRFIPVYIGIKNKIVKRAEAISEITNAMMSEPLDRKKISNLSLEAKSIEAVRKIINFMLQSKAETFKGFNSFFHAIVFRIEFSKSIYMTRKQEISNFYKRIYSAYVRHH